MRTPAQGTAARTGSYSYPMDAQFRKGHIGLLARLNLSAGFILFGLCNAHAQTPATTQTAPAPHPPSVTRPQPATGTAMQRPLPDMNSLMGQVEAQQKASLKTVKEYIFRSLQTQQSLDSHGAVKKTTTEEREHFWINGVPISRLLARDGKPLTGDELKKQNERIDKRIAEARERDQKAASQSSQKKQGSDEVTFARFLELGAFSNPRRVQFNGRDTLAVDYAGDPKAKTRNLLEGAIHDLAGTVWVDEQDHALVRVEGHFFNNFKVTGGLLADVHKGTSFQAEWTKVNNEVWLPARVDAEGSVRALLFVSFNGAVHEADSNYRKFRASSTIVPGVAEVPGTPDPTEPDQPQP